MMAPPKANVRAATPNIIKAIIHWALAFWLGMEAAVYYIRIDFPHIPDVNLFKFMEDVAGEYWSAGGIVILLTTLYEVFRRR